MGFDNDYKFTTHLTLRTQMSDIIRLVQLLFSNLTMNTNGYCRKRIQDYTYNMADQVGKGFSSVVYKGNNQTTGQTVAIKVINLKQIKDGLAKLMLDNEVECLRQMSHPNVLRLQNVYSTINNYYIVTQFCDGDLAKYLRKKQKISETEFMPIFKDIFSGYRMLYCYGYIHRDLKPANMLIKDNKIKIADFGFVKKSLNGLRCPQNYNVGTPLYMAPESMKFNVYTYKSDIWSLGIMFYEMLAGCVPWKCNSETELKQFIFSGKIDYSKLKVSEQLKQFIKNCLEVDENKRISIGEMERNSWVIKVLNQQNEKSHQQENTTDQICQNQQERLLSFDIVKSYINLGRFIFKIISCLSKTEMSRQLSSKIVEELSSNLLFCFNFHRQILSSKCNLIFSKDWSAFVQSYAWTSYQTVVSSYEDKYKTILKNKHSLCYNKQIILGFIKEILQIKQKTANIVICLDYLVSYFQLIQLLERVNWNYEKFCQYSQIDFIMDGRVKDNINPDVLLEKIKTKLYCMGIVD